LNSCSRIDLHLHTEYSKTGDLMLSSLGIKESYTNPQQAYDLAMKRGMDFVTITDHDSIDGALQIAHLENVIIGEEITTYFPEDRARIHVIALDITEAQHAMIQSIRMNIYELVQYLNSENILHYVAHPFFRMTAPLTLEHFEKQLLLFKHFEVKNGGKQLWPDNLLEKILDELTFESVFHLAEKYDIEPNGHEPWVKYHVAGSDDHGGILIASPHTCTPKSSSVTELLNHIRCGHTEICGEGGSPLAVAHSILSVAYHHFKRNTDNRRIKSKIVWNIIGQIFDNTNPNRTLNLLSRLTLFLNEQMDLFGRGAGWYGSIDAVTREFSDLIKSQEEFRQLLHKGLEFNHDNNEKLFALLSALVHRSIARIMNEIQDQTDFNTIVKKLKWLRPVMPGLLVYLIAFKTEYRDLPLMRRVRRKYLHNDSHNQDRIAVFTDTTSREVVHNLVFKNFNNHHLTHDAEIHVLGLSNEAINAPDRENFQSICEIEIQNRRIAFPPVLDIIKQFFEKEFHHIYLHSLGPMGILGLFIGKLLNIPVTCKYPRESFQQFPQDSYTGKNQLPLALLKILMKSMDHIKVSTETEMEHLINLQISMHKIDLVQSSRVKTKPGSSNSKEAQNYFFTFSE